MRRWFLATSLVVVLALPLVGGLAQPAGAQSEFDILVAPAKLELQVPAGQGQDFAISVRNNGAVAQTMRIYFNDYSIKANNEFIFEPPGHYSYSCAKWLQAENGAINVPVGRTVSTGFRVNVPRGAEPGGHYGVIFFEKAPQPGEPPANVRAMPRIGTLVLVTVPGEIVRQGEIKSVSINSTWFWPARQVSLLPKRKVRARIVFYNSGNVHLTVRGSLTYKAVFGWGKGKVEFHEITVLPKTTRYMDADIPDPPLVGSFRIKAKVEYGPALDVFDTTKTGTASFNMYPLSLLLAILVLIGAIVAAFLIAGWRRRARVRKGKIPGKRGGPEELSAAAEKDSGQEPSAQEAGPEAEDKEPDVEQETGGTADDGAVEEEPADDSATSADPAGGGPVEDAPAEEESEGTSQRVDGSPGEIEGTGVIVEDPRGTEHRTGDVIDSVRPRRGGRESRKHARKRKYEAKHKAAGPRK
jgi:hypothetical protein